MAGPLWLYGCAPLAAVGAAASVASSAMDVMGLKDRGNTPQQISLTLNAGKDLNLSRGDPMSVVVRVYYLKEAERFLHAPMAQLLDPAQESALLGTDLTAAHDVTLVPGGRYTHIEPVPREAKVVAIAAFFHTPDVGGWKLAFDAGRNAGDGIVVNVGAQSIHAVRGRAVPARQSDIRSSGAQWKY